MHIIAGKYAMANAVFLCSNLITKSILHSLEMFRLDLGSTPKGFYVRKIPAQVGMLFKSSSDFYSVLELLRRILIAAKKAL